MKSEKINFSEKFKRLPPGDYAIGIIAKLNNYKFKGDFVWYSHSDTDEAFNIIEGVMVTNFRDRKVEVRSGEMIIVPKGVEHKSSSSDGYRALLIEPEGVPNTGGVQSNMTIATVGWV
jgi:mannose-6-phosphate isomerase-like protein (cupin superfamily)